MKDDKWFDLTGKNALITGSVRGIGREILLEMARRGANVIVHASSPRPQLEELAAEARALGVQAATAAADLSAVDGATKLAQAARNAFGRIDILILNASVQYREPWLNIDDEQFETQVNVNLRSSLKLIQEFAPDMTRNQWGRIVTVGSVQQYRPHPDMLVYSMTKAAVVNGVTSLSKQFAPYGVTINNIAPGVFLTDRNTEALGDPDYREKVLGLIPMRKFAEADDCAATAVWLCSEGARYVTGADIPVDGGMRL